MRIGYPRGKAVLLIMVALALMTTGGPAQAGIPIPIPGAGAGAGGEVTPLSRLVGARHGISVDRRLAALRNVGPPPMSARAGDSRVRIPTAGGIAIDETTRTMYVADLDGQRLLVVDQRGCTARRQHCRPPLASIPLGARAEELVVDPVSHTVYASLPDAAAVAVVDVRRCQARDTTGCGAVAPRVPVPGVPLGVALDERTRTVYVGNFADRVTLIDAQSCSGVHPAGCAAPLRTTAAGPTPTHVYVDARRSTVYATNEDGNTLSVIDSRTCRRGDTSGCDRPPVLAPVGAGPFAVLVDPATDTLYVTNQFDGTISVRDAATCNALNTSGCASKSAVTGRVAFFLQALALVPATHTLYVYSDADAVSVLDVGRCHAHDTSGCEQTPRTIQTDAEPWTLLLDQHTGSLYVTAIADGTLQVLDPRTCSSRRSDGCRRPAPTAESGSYGLAVDPEQHTLYSTRPDEGTLTLLDTRTCNADHQSGCEPALPAIPLGTTPADTQIDLATHTLYIADPDDQVVRVLDTRTCNVSTPSGCTPVASVPVGPINGVGINPQTHTLYVTSYDDKRLRVLPGAHCNATDLSGCSAPQRTVDLGVSPFYPFVEESTDTVYVPSTDEDGVGSLTLVDGAACDRGTSACRVIGRTTVGRGPVGIDADPATHTLYTAIINDFGQPAVLSMLDTRTCSRTRTNGCGTTWPTARTVHASFGVTVDRRTHRIFNVGLDGALAVISGRHCNSSDQSRCPRRPRLIAVGNHAAVTRIDPSRHTAYTLNSFDRTVSLVDTRRPCRDHLCFRR